ncbi:pantoate--beta-alanine ligase [Chromobacterium piscinae]|uniref:Pantothenate synthetase n=1 Tax=Chromobacterium piscinae TaxID=686831 RepID=A0ABV0H7S2_9NEIS|nr:pantoate--beta-alanine ligase [Chromobacterium piscinae]MBX9298552.1 pantoate--beta-alanine ligase [Chromobacterium vaccinii]MBX9347966.1 pantoate--beta-alanine ligase [Chromobacterium vaccinii]MBX9357945.1 pantoate--beta-alanine ligase [Chromobacterium vaccinii]MCD4505631.1 pantoate--beta-alanine ligase [Chromobacterium piscinae]MCD5330270.1 pantoate--beta-alanine ligase [Chromobacterium piscinae]
MEIIRTVAEMRAWRKQAGKLAFVPTMGNLHEGHLKLVAAARARAEKVVVSIFVNRLQFGQGEDFDAYPRTFDADCAKLAAAGVDALFFPTERELYPRVRQDFNVEPPHIQDELCGAFRPGHFRGVATVVTKLFNIVQPDLACFGKKDYQQLHVIQAMIADLNSPIEIVPVDTGRAADGLALSSRNGYLSAEERAEAPRLYRNLSMIRDGLLSGSQDYAALENAAREDLAAAGWTVDYVEVRQADTLEIAHAGEKRLVALAAARLGKTRLIDNIEVFR